MSFIISLLTQIANLVKPLLGIIYVLLLIAAIPVAVIGGLFAAISLVPTSFLDTIRNALSSGLSLLTNAQSTLGNSCNQSSQYTNGSSSPCNQLPQFSAITTIITLISNILDPSNLSSIQGTLQTVGYIILGFGGGLLIVGIVGCCGVCCNKKPMLYVNILLSFLLIGGTLAALILWLNDALDPSVFALMIAELKRTYNGTYSQGNDSLVNFETNLMNLLMAELHCCGLENYTEFQQAFNWYPQYVYYTNQQTNQTYNRTKIIPETCCVLNGTYLAGPVTPLDSNCTVAPTSNNSYIDLSCRSALSYSHILGGITAIVIDVLSAFTAFEGVSLILSIYLVAKTPVPKKPNPNGPAKQDPNAPTENPDSPSYGNQVDDPSKSPYAVGSPGPYGNRAENPYESGPPNFYGNNPQYPFPPQYPIGLNGPPYPNGPYRPQYPNGPNRLQYGQYPNRPQYSTGPNRLYNPYGNPRPNIYGNYPQSTQNIRPSNPYGNRPSFPQGNRLRYHANSGASPYGNVYGTRQPQMTSNYSPYGRAM